MWVHLKNREAFGLAGLWDVWRKPDGKRVESFTIITTEPNELVRPIHNRMPVILRPEDEEQWLDASRTPFVKAKSLLKTLSRRDDGRSRRFTNHQLGKV
jgi:putative SOS response-associated peptidase YedK